MNDSGSLNDYLNNLNGTFSTFSTEGSSEQVYGAKPEKPSIESLKVDEDGITEYVTPDMLIGDIITWYPEASLVLMKCGMHCISCGVSQFETLDQACAVHGLYTDDVAKVVNDYLTQTLGGKAEQLAKEAENKDN
ncbi:MAG: DUF1858 domain-containing protein [Eubacterium sp.]|nr:DUF1858 domain-containing protein [Eubacterium sp.]